ncbi:MAG: ABC-2 family transporter protein [Patescibacteria group bacterium]
MSRNSFVAVLSQRVSAAIFITGKLLRFGFFLAFLYFLLRGTNTLAGYNFSQTVFFFLTFNLIDITAQFLFREVYRFRPLVISGSFDMVLAKPISPLFRSLLGGADILDLTTIPPLILVIYLVGRSLAPLPLQVFYFLLLVFNGLMLATAFHIAVISLGIITLEIDRTIMIYWDLTNLGRLPVDIYKEPLRGILTYLIPVGIMITLPAKALMGLVSLAGVLASFAIGVVAVFLSIKFWNFALTKYTSASS